MKNHEHSTSITNIQEISSATYHRRFEQRLARLPFLDLEKGADIMRQTGLDYLPFSLRSICAVSVYDRPDYELALLIEKHPINSIQPNQHLDVLVDNKMDWVMPAEYRLYHYFLLISHSGARYLVNDWLRSVVRDQQRLERFFLSYHIQANLRWHITETDKHFRCPETNALLGWGSIETATVNSSVADRFHLTDAQKQILAVLPPAEKGKFLEKILGIPTKDMRTSE